MSSRAAAIALSLAVLGAATALPPLAWGAGFATVPGTSERVGRGEAYRFQVEVQRSIPINRREFAAELEAILFDRRSWTRSRAVAFRRVDERADTRIILARPRRVDRLCHPLPTEGEFSCRVGEVIALNLRRWREGVDHWPDSLEDYRRMLVNHEFGHRIGHGHRPCGGAGQRAPVMQQQSMGLDGCRANPWPTRSELRDTRRLHR